MKRIKFIIFVRIVYMLMLVMIAGLFADSFLKVDAANNPGSNETVSSNHSFELSESGIVSDSSSQSKEIVTSLQSEMVLKHETISAVIDLDKRIEDYYFLEENISVTESYIDTNGLQIDLVAQDDFGRLEVFLNSGDGKYQKSCIYTYAIGDKVFVSDVSEDTAWYNGMLYRYNKGLITYDEWERAYREYSRKNVVRSDDGIVFDEIADNPIKTAGDKTTYAKGYLRFQLADGQRQPQKYIRVQLCDKDLIGHQVLATTYTDSNGYFSFTFENNESWLENGGYDIFIRWYPESYTLQVAQDWLFTWNYSESDCYDNITSGNTYWFNYYNPYNEDSNVTKSYYVAQGMIVGQRFAMAMGMNTSRFLNVIYPFGDGTAFCWNQFSGIGNSDFNKWDTLIHEYGHFVQGAMGTYGSTLLDIILNNPSHNTYTDHFHDKDNKTFAMQLTWSEAWATAFSFIAQQYYKSEYTKIPFSGDVYYNGSTKNYESYSPTNQSCEAQEDAVIAFLWDLYDPYSSSESADQISLGYSNWWHATTRSGTHTLTDFANVVETYYPEYRGLIGERLGYHQIAPGNLTIKNASGVSSTTPPQLSWRVNGSTYNPNNRFQVAFYNTSGEEVYTTGNIASTISYNQTFDYNISPTVWNNVLNNFSGTVTINIAVKGYHTASPVSGPYVSAYQPVTLTAPNEQLNIKAYNRYTEDITLLAAGHYKDYILTFSNSGYRVIQTFGPKDAYLELYSATGEKIAYNDDAGYRLNALLSYNFAANTQYRLRVKFWSSYQTGEVKVAIVPSLSYDSYENIFQGPENWHSHTGSLQLYKVRLLRYHTSTVKTIELRTSSSIDTYLYLIDPRSTAPISSNFNNPSVYNDDGGGNLQARIVKTLDANIPYLIIVAAYNPSTTSGSYVLYF